MDLVTHFLAIGLLVWFALLAGIIGVRILRGDIATEGFLHTRRVVDDPGGSVAPERVLSMTVFPVVIVGYAVMALQTNIHVAHPALPDIPNDLFMLLTGGNGAYLAGKIARIQ